MCRCLQGFDAAEELVSKVFPVGKLGNGTGKLLFKSCSGGGEVKFLERKSILITCLLDLNDPFEMRPAWIQDHEARYTKELDCPGLRVSSRSRALIFSRGLFVPARLLLRRGGFINGGVQ